MNWLTKIPLFSFVTIEKGNVETKQGFGFIKTVIIDQHFLKRKRHNRTISALIEHPNLLGVAIDESTSIIVNPDETFRSFREQPGSCIRSHKSNRYKG